MTSLYAFSILLFGGMLFASLLGKLKFPKVTGYLIGGIILGPSLLGVLSRDMVSSLEIISEVALSFIAFSVGNEMKLKHLQKLGSKILIITFFEAIGAFLVVTLGLIFLFGSDIPFAITLGAISCATAPAATLMVIKEYRAQGEIVDVLIPVVALDDGIGIIIYGISSSIATALLSGGAVNLTSMFLKPIGEILMAIVLGGVTGFLMSFLLKRMKNQEELLASIIAYVFLITAITMYLNLSSLLTLMAAGIAVGNLSTSRRRFAPLLDLFTTPIFIAFFVLSGADLTLSALAKVGGIGAFYIVARVIGKYFGAMFSTKITNCSAEVQKYLGLTLVPQAGVALGLSLMASKLIPAPHGTMIRTVVLGATIFYEILGPFLAKYAFTKAGAIEDKPRTKPVTEP